MTKRREPNMTRLTVDKLFQTLRECAGEDEPDSLSAAVLDVPFDDLGYDSLAILNTVRRIEADHAIELGDDLFDVAPTPRALLEEVNLRLAGQGSRGAVPSVE
jgi:act minimal PKS acyl carrier protein